jgi:NADPH-dependent curcumin reductase CurA
MESLVNHRIVLASRPRGTPRASDFRYEATNVPALTRSEVLVRTQFLSLDPYMRNAMDEVAPIYATSIALGAVIVGSTVGRVIASEHPNFRNGDLVLGNGGWQEYWLSDGTDLTPLGTMPRPSLALGALGMPAFTAHVGLLDIGKPQPGETVVVAAATGAVGSNVGQIARLKGARVVGIAGSAEKCRYAVEVLGFDVCLDRRDPRFSERLAEACPRGIDVYFENVGGEVLESVLPLLNVGARIPVCGFIAHYNDESLPPGPNRLPQLLSAILQKRVHVQGFIILDHYGERYDAFISEMQQWLASDQIKTREHIVDGLENAPAAFNDLLEGRNFGKVVVRVSTDT